MVLLSSPLGRFRDEIAGILDPRKWPLDWVEQQIGEGRITLHENKTAIIGIEVREYPGGLMELHGLFAAGDLAGIKELIGDAVEAGRLAGCHTAAISSREGWARTLRDMGFKMDQVTISKDLRDGS
jgi:hypothetical protein